MLTSRSLGDALGVTAGETATWDAREVFFVKGASALDALIEAEQVVDRGAGGDRDRAEHRDRRPTARLLIAADLPPTNTDRSADGFSAVRGA